MTDIPGRYLINEEDEIEGLSEEESKDESASVPNCEDTPKDYISYWDTLDDWKIFDWALDEDEVNAVYRGEKIEHQDYYTWHPVAECIDIIGEFPWCIGEAIKYLWRAGRKNPDKEIQDLRKAIVCIEAEIERKKDDPTE